MAHKHVDTLNRRSIINLDMRYQNKESRNMFNVLWHEYRIDESSSLRLYQIAGFRGPFISFLRQMYINTTAVVLGRAAYALFNYLAHLFRPRGGVSNDVQKGTLVL